MEGAILGGPEPIDLQTIAIVNQKGGVGKASLAMNLAWFLGTAGGRTSVAWGYT